jgi:hypothetical protein
VALLVEEVNDSCRPPARAKYPQAVKDDMKEMRVNEQPFNTANMFRLRARNDDMLCKEENGQRCMMFSESETYLGTTLCAE